MFCSHNNRGKTFSLVFVITITHKKLTFYVLGCSLDNTALSFPLVCNSSSFAVRKLNDDNWKDYESGCLTTVIHSGQKVINVSRTHSKYSIAVSCLGNTISGWNLKHSKCYL